jgi:two-component system phosphate regulon sensor histidine kinase PhoR
MSSRNILILVLSSLLLIFGTQIFLINDYYRTTRASWSKESNTILEETFRSDLSIRNSVFREIIMDYEIVISPVDLIEENIPTVDLSDIQSQSVIGVLDMAIHKHISSLVPIDLRQLDSIAQTILLARDMHSNFTVNIVNNTTGEILAASKDNWRFSLFLISSERMLIDTADDIALQLHLINPFQIIIKRMGLMLTSSLVLAIICLLAFIYLQKVLARQKKLVAFKNEFLGTIAHELKRPVSSLTFNLDCLSMTNTSLNSPQNSLLLHNSIRATEELNESITMIVALSKHEEGMLMLRNESIDMKAMMEELRDKFSEQRFKDKQVMIALHVHDVQAAITGDRLLLYQCFANLLDNAIKYAGDVVKIVVRIEREGNRLLVGIKDNGFGIPPDQLDLIFDKYSRVHQSKTQIKGFGIGLNYVKSIVEKHEGEVRVTSEPGVGSEFCVLLPIA